jgi:diguanylate cyclase (GGDEF)-like protein/PAS domain S-box-containing protein
VVEPSDAAADGAPTGGGAPPGDDDSWRDGWPVGSPDLCQRIVLDDPYGRMMIDLDGVVRHLNPAAADMLGLPAEQVLGRSIATFLSPASVEVATRMLTQVLDTDQEDIPVDFELARADGVMLPVEVGGHRYVDDPLHALHLRIRPAARERFMERFLTELVSGSPLATSLGLLARSVDATVPASATAIVHGWDGHHFTGASAPAVGERVWQACKQAIGDEEARDALPWYRAMRSGRDDPVHGAVDDLPPDLAAVARADGFQACWVFPVLVPPDVAPTAAVVVWRRPAGDPLHGQSIAVGKIIDAVALAVGRDRAQRRLVRAATRDPLTDLLNREELLSRLGAVLDRRPPSPCGVLYIDLDRFKPVNDHYGHRFGDSLLALIGARLAAAVRSTDHLARIGGDEFVVLCPDLSTEDAATTLGDILIEALEQPLELGGVRVRVGASIGVALAPRHGTTPIELVDAADRGLYAAKRAGRGCVRIAPDHPADPTADPSADRPRP